MSNKILERQISARSKRIGEVSTLALGELDADYVIKEIRTKDVEMKEFLFTLGCYEGEHITIISKLSNNLVVAVKDARYSIDTELAEAIII